MKRNLLIGIVVAALLLGVWWLVYPHEPKIVYIVPFGGFENDKLFDIQDPKLNRDNARLPFHTMREAFKRLGYTVKTTTRVQDFKAAHAVICFDIPLEFPEMLKSGIPKEKFILFMFEPPTIKPYNFVREYHEPFGKIYTQLDDLVDNKKYFKFYEPQIDFSVGKNSTPFEDRKLCAMIAGNKKSTFQLELYSQRQKMIDFFENKQTGEFDLYGPGWPAYSSYRGYVDSKTKCLSRYRFNICYENMHGVRGYITEKLFNSFPSATVPVYWGAPNITDYVPKNCFIDRRDFNDEHELYAYLKSMDKKTYNTYLENIKNYVTTAQAAQFSTENFADIVISSVLPGYNRNKAFTKEQLQVLVRLGKA
jgi:hypothetical protein